MKLSMTGHLEDLKFCQSIHPMQVSVLCMLLFDSNSTLDHRDVSLPSLPHHYHFAH